MGGITEAIAAISFTTVATDAAVGFAMGAVISGVTGGDPLKGGLLGGLTGAIGGAASSALDGAGATADAAATTAEDSSIGSTATQALDTGATADAVGASGTGLTQAADSFSLAPDAPATSEFSMGAPSSASDAINAGSDVAAAPAVSPVAAPAVGPAADAGNIINANAGGGFGTSPYDMSDPYGGFAGDSAAANRVGATAAASGSGSPNWLERNGRLVGTVTSGLLSGIGAGLGGLAQANAATARQQLAGQQQMSLQTQQQNYVTSNYANPTGLLSGANPSVAGNPTPSQRYPRSYGGSYQYDSASGRIVFVPNSVAPAAPAAAAAGASA